jgi:S-adenosylmethionine-diacylglycerol 3-amino-3-carboxypropyl transferase
MAIRYFKSLNYTASNEDTSLELAVLPENVNHVFAVAGSGSRIIPLLSKKPSRLTCVDSSFEQIALTEMRIACLKILNYEDYLAFWGYAHYNMSPDRRKKTFNDLIISTDVKSFLNKVFERNNWHSILYLGRWERAFKKLSQLNKAIIGKRGLGIFNCLTKEEQEIYLKNIFPHRAWSFSIFLLGNAFMFNTLLYKGHFPRKNISESMYIFYLNKFKYLFKQGPARNNYFLQLLLLGRLNFSDGLPIECDPEIFLKAKNNLKKVKVAYVCGDILSEAKKTRFLIDFLSFSDIPSYFNSPQEQNFLQEVRDRLYLGGIVVNRYYLRIPENIDSSGYKKINENFKKDIEQEKTQMYSFGIYQKIK